MWSDAARSASAAVRNSAGSGVQQATGGQASVRPATGGSLAPTGGANVVQTKRGPMTVAPGTTGSQLHEAVKQANMKSKPQPMGHAAHQARTNDVQKTMKPPQEPKAPKAPKAGKPQYDSGTQVSGYAQYYGSINA